MAKTDIKMPDEFLRSLSKLGDKTDEIAERVLEAGGEIVLGKLEHLDRLIINMAKKLR